MNAVPQLRFPGFEGPWRPARAGDAFRSRRARGEAGLPIYSVTLDRGMVPRDSLERRMDADAADGANLRAMPGDLVYNMMRMWQGAVGLSAVECMVSPAYVVLDPKDGISAPFFDQWFKNDRMRHLLGAYSHGITSDRLRLYFDDFARIPINLPTLAEQDKIATALQLVDQKIEALRRKKDGLSAFKSALMEKLFSQQLRLRRKDGSAYPDWEIRKLSQVCSKPEYGLNRSAVPYDGKRGYLRITDIDEESRRFKASDITSPEGDVDSSYRMEIGDIAFARTGAGTGRSYLYVAEDGELYFAGFLIRFRVIEGVPLFIYQQTLTERFRDHVRIMSARSGQPGMNADEFGLFSIDFPSIEEQLAISWLLDSMDARVAMTSKKIELMTEFRQGLVQQLFV